MKKDFWAKKDVRLDNKDGDSIAPSEAPTEIDVRRRIKYGKPLQAAWGLFSEYSNSSTIHGVKYLGERRRPLAERIWWIVAFALSLYACGRLILNIWDKWDQSPVIVSFAEKSTPVWQIPFPAVTICPETKAKAEFLNYTDGYHILHNESPPFNISDDDFVRMRAVSQICDAHLAFNVSFGEKYSSKDCVDYIRELAPGFDEVLFQCKWRNSFDTCEDLFSELLTEEGICYTFNLLSAEELYREEEIQSDYKYLNHTKKSGEWSLESGYTKEASLDSYPVRVLGAGAKAGLFILLRLYDYDLDYICRGPVQGFKILLHTPGEIPQVSKQYFRVPLDQEVIVSVKPNMITTADGLKHYPPNRRQCFFNKERHLQFFKMYTQQNCELECLANHTLTKCGCVKFSMPRSADTKICGPDLIECFSDAEYDLLIQEFHQGMASSADGVRGETKCNCLPACTSIVYDAEISQAEFDWTNLFNAYDTPLDEFPGVRLARLGIFFKETQFITSKRSELYGPTDFLANCGGLLGLFMGVSILSLVEVIYFCTIRLVSNLWMRKMRPPKKTQAALNEYTPGTQGIYPKL